MFKLFRNLRRNLLDRNRTRTYLAYAGGEIVLVVIGILIALQINNLNEERKERKNEKAVLAKFLQDLRSDSISYARNLNTTRSINRLHRRLYEYGVLGNDSVRIENPSYIRRLLYYNPIARENDPFIANRISDDGLRTQILDYFRYMTNMDLTYQQMQDVIHERMRVFLADKGVHDLTAWFEDYDQVNLKDDEGYRDIVPLERLKELSKTEAFQQLLFEASIKAIETKLELEALIGKNHELILSIENRLNPEG